MSNMIPRYLLCHAEFAATSTAGPQRPMLPALRDSPNGDHYALHAGGSVNIREEAPLVPKSLFVVVLTDRASSPPSSHHASLPDCYGSPLHEREPFFE